MATAPAEQQERLLKVQELDTIISRTEADLLAMPEDAALAANATDLEEATTAEVLAKAAVSDAQRAVDKADDEVQSVRTRAKRDTDRSNASGTSAKDLQALQSELELLARRQSALEDQELEAMERLEEAQQAQADAGARAEQLRAERVELQAARDEAAQTAEETIAGAIRDREAFGAGLDPAMVKLYERIRDGHGGVGAAALVHGTCQGCHMAIGSADRAAIAAAPADEIVRCEECGCILVRTAA